MANPEHVRILQQGVAVWNHWRQQNPGVQPDLRGQSFKGQDLSGVNLSGANICSTDFSQATLCSANFSNARAGLLKRWAIILFLVSGLLAAVCGSAGYH